MQSDKNRIHEFIARNPNSWEERADNLKRAADKVYEICYDAFTSTRNYIKEGREPDLQDVQDFSVIAIYYLLMGYALENLLKGILIMRQPEMYVQQGNLTGLKTHKLVKLFEDCKLPVDQETKELLEKLTRHIVWQGKYPIPLRAEDRIPGSYSGILARTIQKELDQLYEQVLQEFKEEQSRQRQQPL
jgi:hypothetical protein